MSHFFAYISKLKYINRWGIMRNTAYENDMEHSMMVTMVAHSLCEISQRVYDRPVDTSKAVLMAMYHETSEVLTGDLPTPIKYYNQDIFKSFKDIESIATKTVFDMLPEKLMDGYSFMLDATDCYEKKIVKAADKICAYLKCIEELKLGNMEFSKAKDRIKEQIDSLNMDVANYWMKEFAPSFALTIDELN